MAGPAILRKILVWKICELSISTKKIVRHSRIPEKKKVFQTKLIFIYISNVII